MPQATDELRRKMEGRFGTIDAGPPIKFLEDAGYSLDANWFWSPKPGVVELDDMTGDEYDCLLFLVQEWDFGGLTTETG